MGFNPRLRAAGHVLGGRGGSDEVWARVMALYSSGVTQTVSWGPADVGAGTWRSGQCSSEFVASLNCLECSIGVRV